MTKAVDWDLVEREYSAGLLSNRQIASKHGISEGAVRLKAKKFGWAKDLKEKIRLATEKKVREAAYAKSTQGRLDEKGEVEEAAKTQAEIILTHRKDIVRARTIGGKLFAELEAQTDNAGDFEALGELLKNPEANYDRLNDLYRKATSMPGRVETYKKLTESLKNCIGLERQAFGLADNANGDADTQPKPVDPSLPPAEAYRLMVHGGN